MRKAQAENVQKRRKIWSHLKKKNSYAMMY